MHEEYVTGDKIPEEEDIDVKVAGMELTLSCQECDSTVLLFEGRCTTCMICGWSKCSI